MITKRKLQMAILLATSFFLTLLLIEILILQKPIRQKKALEKKQKITIPFEDLKQYDK